MAKEVVVDAFAERAALYPGHAAVVIDVLRATTTAVTAVANGRRCFPVPSIERAVPVAARLDRPLLCGELGGNMPYGFDLHNSPAAVSSLNGDGRPIILLSTSGTSLIHAASESTDAVFVACLRNVSATARHVAERFDRVVVLGAGTRGEFREEDELCCAWIAAWLVDLGFAPVGDHTAPAIERWRDAPVQAIETSKSVTYLRDTNQLHDLDFVLSHVDDIDNAYAFRTDEIVAA